MRPRWIHALRCVVASLAFVTLGCGEAPPVLATPEAEPAPVAVVAKDPPTLQVAAADPEQPAGQLFTIDARTGPLNIGRFRAGDRLRVQVVETRWTNCPGCTLMGAGGDPLQRCIGGRAHSCLGGEDAAPLMGLIAVISPRNVVSTRCDRNRIPAGHGVEFEVPATMDVSLFAQGSNPGGWVARGEDTTVRVELSQRRDTPVHSRFDVVLNGRTGEQSVGRFQAGQYLRVTVLGPVRDTASIVLGTAVCQTPSFLETQPERRFLPLGGEIVVEREGDVSLGPNDWEDGMFDNEGFCRVAVDVIRR